MPKGLLCNCTPNAKREEHGSVALGDVRIVVKSPNASHMPSKHAAVYWQEIADGEAKCESCKMRNNGNNEI